MSPQLEPVVEKYISDAEARGYFIRGYLIERVDYIVYNANIGLNDDRIASTDVSYRKVYLSERIRGNDLLIELAVYHELGHILTLSSVHSCHSCFDIMAEYAQSSTVAYENEEFLELKKDEYFKWLSDMLSQ